MPIKINKKIKELVVKIEKYDEKYHKVTLLGGGNKKYAEHQFLAIEETDLITLDKTYRFKNEGK